MIEDYKPGIDETKDDTEVTLGDFKKIWNDLGKTIKINWKLILILVILGGIAGLIYSIVKKPIYKAVYTFVLEEEGSGGLGQYSSLASLAGIDIGSAAGGGIFQGDNILELYKSHKMIEKTLLSTGNFEGRHQKLIDRYIDVYKLRKSWAKEKFLTGIDFNGDPNHFNRHQDSIISDLVKIINKGMLSVVKPDKKLNIIEVNVSSEDELLSKEFANLMVDNVNNFYIQTKTKKLSQNLNILQKQADSVKSVLNNALKGVAQAADISPNANSLISTLRVSAQRKQVDVQASSAIYVEVVKNLELAKIQLRKELPLIQAIDTPILPLFVEKLGRIKGTLLGLILGAVLAFGWMLFIYLKNK